MHFNFESLLQLHKTSCLPQCQTGKNELKVIKIGKTKSTHAFIYIYVFNLLLKVEIRDRVIKSYFLKVVIEYERILEIFVHHLVRQTQIFTFCV